MTRDPTPKEKDAIWALLGEGGQGKGPPKAAREALAGLGLLRVGYRGGAKPALVELTDAGWKWAGDTLGRDDATAVKALQPWLRQLATFLAARHLQLADFFPNAPEPLQETLATAPKRARTPVIKPAPSKPASGRKPTVAQIRKRLVAAYAALTAGRHGGRALLSDIRAHLADIDRATLDKALAGFAERDPHMQFMRLDNPREMTPAIRAGALEFKGEPLHLLWMTS